LILNNVLGIGIVRLSGLHDRYGPIVRIAPNRLSLDGSVAWTDVYGHRPDRPEFSKISGVNAGAVGLFNARRDDHRRQRRLLSHAFSDAALAEQEDCVKHYVDLLMQRLGECAEADAPVDITMWFNLLTFDIIGDLAWADPFNSLEKGGYHPWVAMIFRSIRLAALVAVTNSYPFLKPLVLLVFGRDVVRKRREFNNLTENKVDKRIELGADAPRRDFMTYVLRHGIEGEKDKDAANSGEKKGMTRDEIRQTSTTLIIAGSETTATALSGLMFYLGRHPDVYNRVVQEIRSTFTSEGEINIKSTARLQYLHACLEEALRIYPPAPVTSPRVSYGDTIGGLYVPKGVSSQLPKSFSFSKAAIVYLHVHRWPS
jgi:cytochrome P450